LSFALRKLACSALRLTALEIIAANPTKAGWTWAASQPLIPKGEQSGLLTRIATESVSLCARMKY